MSFLSRLSIFLSFSIVIIAAILRWSPDYVFFIPIPGVGPLLWALLGLNFPPFFDLDALRICVEREKCPWLKDNDVIVSVGAKCGTNWLLTIVHELRTWDTPDLKDFNDILEISPWPELRQFPFDSLEHAYEHWGNIWNNSRLKFREYKTHIGPYVIDKNRKQKMVLPVRELPNVKFVVGIRNPYDSLLSQIFFADFITPEAANLWGSLPNLPSTVPSILGMFETSPILSTFQHVNAWIDFKNEPNVLLIHYSELTNNLRPSLRKIAVFLGLNNITEEALSIVEKRVSFDFMKKHDNRYGYLVGRDKTIRTVGKLIREGGVGKNASFTAEELEMIKKAAINVMGEEKFNFILH